MGAMMANSFFCLICIGGTVALRGFLKMENRKLGAQEGTANADEEEEGEQTRVLRKDEAESGFRYVI